MDLGSNIKKYREIAGLTMDDLSNKLHVSKSTISRYESNSRKPSYDMLEKIATVLSVPINSLLSISDQKVLIEDKVKKIIDMTNTNYNEHTEKLVCLDNETCLLKRQLLDFLIKGYKINPDTAHLLCSEIIDYIKLRIKYIKKDSE